MKLNSTQIDYTIDRFNSFCSETHYELKDEEPESYYIEYYIFQGEFRKFLTETLKEVKQWHVLTCVSLAVVFFLLGMFVGASFILWSLS